MFEAALLNLTFLTISVMQYYLRLVMLAIITKLHMPLSGYLSTNLETTTILGYRQIVWKLICTEKFGESYAQNIFRLIIDQIFGHEQFELEEGAPLYLFYIT